MHSLNEFSNGSAPTGNSQGNSGPVVFDIERRMLIAAMLQELRTHTTGRELSAPSLEYAASTAYTALQHIPLEALENRAADSLTEECKRRKVFSAAHIAEVWDSMTPQDGGAQAVTSEIRRRESANFERGEGYAKLLAVGEKFGWTKGAR